jgi:hypothetical protein
MVNGEYSDPILTKGLFLGWHDAFDCPKARRRLEGQKMGETREFRVTGRTSRLRR